MPAIDFVEETTPIDFQPEVIDFQPETPRMGMGDLHVAESAMSAPYLLPLDIPHENRALMELLTPPGSDTLRNVPRTILPPAPRLPSDAGITLPFPAAEGATKEMEEGAKHGTQYGDVFVEGKGIQRIPVPSLEEARPVSQEDEAIREAGISDPNNPKLSELIFVHAPLQMMVDRSGPDASAAERLLRGSTRGLLSAAGGLVSLPTVAAPFMRTPGLQRLLSGLFAVPLTKATIDSAERFSNAAAEGDIEKAAESLMEGGASAYFGYKTLSDTLRPGLAKESPLLGRLLEKQIKTEYSSDQLKDIYGRVTRGAEHTPAEAELVRFLNEQGAPGETIRGGFTKITQGRRFENFPELRDWLYAEGRWAPPGTPTTAPTAAPRPASAKPSELPAPEVRPTTAEAVKDVPAESSLAIANKVEPVGTPNETSIETPSQGVVPSVSETTQEVPARVEPVRAPEPEVQDGSEVKTTPKQQKSYLLEHLDEAIAKAPDAPAERTPTEADADLAAIQPALKKSGGGLLDGLEPLMQKYGVKSPYESSYRTIDGQTERNTWSEGAALNQLHERIKQAVMSGAERVTIQVPGDGTFSVPNHQTALKEFRDEVRKHFPAAAAKAGYSPRTVPEPSKVQKAIKEPTEKDILDAAELAVSTDPEREQITSAYSNGSELIATDGRRLVRIVGKVPGTADEPVLIKDGKITKATAAGKTSSLFPDYRQVIPKERTLIAGGVDIGELFNSLRQAEILQKDGKDNSFKLYRNPDGTLGITAADVNLGEMAHNVHPDARYVATYSLEYFPDAITIARKLGNQKVDFYVADHFVREKQFSDLGPLVIAGKNFEYVLMPMRSESGAARPGIDLASLRAGSPMHKPLPASIGPKTTEVPAAKPKPKGRRPKTDEMMDFDESSAPSHHPMPKSMTLQSTGGHGLPAGVPDRGSGFAAELLEASRQLKALVRSRATLRPGVLGQFVRTVAQDKIEVGDIQNQRTVSHEIGHAIDGTIFGTHGLQHSQASLVGRTGGTGTKQELFNELKAVSELMRGPITGPPAHVRYRKRASELVADYYSLYAHDPARAQAVAPKFTQGFENALNAHPDTKAVVDQLKAGNVNPQAPVRPASSTTAPIKMVGKVPMRNTHPAVGREFDAAKAAQGLVKEAVRTLESQLQSARILTDKWRKQVPERSARNDIGAFIEGIGNLEIAGDTIAAVEARMTPKMRHLAKEYRFRIELLRQEINKYLKDTEQGEYLKFLEDYLGHFYNAKPDQMRSALSRWQKNSPHAKERKLPTLKEAVDLGLEPITQDPATTYELNARVNWRVATNRKVVAELKNLHALNGDPLVVPAGEAPPGWVKTDNPLIQRVYARQTPNGLELWKGGAAIHPDVWHAVRQILELPTSSELGKFYDAINSITRANAFAFSFFHDMSLRFASAGAGARWSNPLRGLIRIGEVNPLTDKREVIRSTRTLGKEMTQNEEIATDAALHGLKFARTDSESYQKQAVAVLDKFALARRGKRGGTIAQALADIQSWRQKALWENTHDAYKLMSYHDIVGKLLQKAPPGTDAAMVKDRVASMLNDAFGGQEWQTQFWLSPEMRKVILRFMLAPDWTLSTIRSVPGVSDAASLARSQAPRLRGREPIPASFEGKIGNKLRARFWIAEVLAVGLMTMAMQYVLYKAFGKKEEGDQPFPWQNEHGGAGLLKDNRFTVDVTPITRQMPWHDPNDKTRHYVNLGKRAAEIVRWVSDPFEQAQSKAARPVSEIFKQIVGSEGQFPAEWERDHQAFLETIPARLKSVGKEFLPFSLTGNQFALSVPMRKGMTKFKAQEAFQTVYELQAEPSGFKAFLRGVPFDTDKGIEQISEAALLNGVNSEVVRKQALSIVRGHHYDAFWKALQKGDENIMEKEAEALGRLGATAQGLQESMKRKQSMLIQ